jgi:hypothetical protein
LDANSLSFAIDENGRSFFAAQEFMRYILRRFSEFWASG